MRGRCARLARRAEFHWKTVKLIRVPWADDLPRDGEHVADRRGAVVAERTGIPVVSDFRTRDIAAGGRGAPLVPYVDYLLYRDRRLGRVALNIGGIANLTAIAARARREDVIAFDTGPGNMVVDALVEVYSGGKQRFDRGGRIARAGHRESGSAARVAAEQLLPR